MYGENVVLRILDRSEGIPKLSELGFSNENYNKLKKILKSSYGLILATGPTGCGKTTTNLSVINTLNRPSLNLMTIEDPIEYEIEGIVQSQVNPKIDFDFANGLRSILRQDPDIIYVGEIRDYETAEVAIRSALTGHLVISTLHTNNAVGAIVRLRDMGVENGLIGFLLNCAFAQRLIRRICPRCKEECQPDEILLKGLKIPANMKFYKGKGCDYCSGIGSKGRIGIFEILVTDKHIKQLIVNNASEEEITQAARAKGMKSLFEDGLQKVVDGISSLEEVKRVTM